jgi:hypothetical protein
VDDDEALRYLRDNYRTAYVIADDGLSAARRDGKRTIDGGTPQDLLAAVRSDYNLDPVVRDPDPALTVIDGAWRDDVARKNALEAAHPDLAITTDDHGWHFKASWGPREDRKSTGRVSGLGTLMDYLEKVLPAQDAEAAS